MVWPAWFPVLHWNVRPGGGACGHSDMFVLQVVGKILWVKVLVDCRGNKNTDYDKRENEQFRHGVASLTLVVGQRRVER